MQSSFHDRSCVNRVDCNPVHNHLTGHAAISKALEPHGIGVATGEHCQNRVIFKQFFQAKGFQFCQIDSCRMGGLNEVLAVLLMAAKFGGMNEFE